MSSFVREMMKKTFGGPKIFGVEIGKPFGNPREASEDEEPSLQTAATSECSTPLAPEMTKPVTFEGASQTKLSQPGREIGEIQEVNEAGRKETPRQRRKLKKLRRKFKSLLKKLHRDSH